MTRRLAAILAADMVGYSRLMAANEVGTLARLKALRREIIDPEIAKAGGEIVKLTGDGMLVLFGSVLAAVEAAAAVQKAVASAEAITPTESRIAFRIGINLGDVMLDDGDVYGDGVNVAARLEAAAETGSILVSDAVYQQVRGKTDLRFTDLGELELKNIPAPVRAHRIDLGTTATVNAFEQLTGRKPEIPDEPSIAVLPFDNMSTDPEQAYFADGITEDIITELSRFRDLLVIARNSTFRFKGRPADLRDVSRDLGVRYLVEGSVRRSGNRVRVTAQLIDATTGSHLWAERYDRNLDDIFAIQEEITAAIVGSVAPQVTRAETERVRRSSTPVASAHDLSLKAWDVLADGFARGDQEAFRRAIAIADEAVAIDPNCIRALRALASAHAFIFFYRWSDAPEQALRIAREVIDRAILIHPDEAALWYIRGQTSYFGGDYASALSEFRRAFDLNPNNAQALFWLGWAEAQNGHAAAGREHIQRGLRLSPRDHPQVLGVAYLGLTLACFSDGDMVETRKWARLAIQMQPSAPLRHALMIAAATLAGDTADAAKHRRILAGFAPEFVPGVIEGKIPVYQDPDENARLVAALQQAEAASA